MASAPQFNIDPQAFWQDPYPTLAQMQEEAPIAYVPQLGSILFTRRDDITECEKRIDVFSSDQPQGLMTVLMGQNMMRKDGDAHLSERKAIFPTVSPRTVRDVWTARFHADCAALLEHLKAKGEADLVADFAMPLSGQALCAITGLENMDWRTMDRVSQAMIDGISNYLGDADVEARCHAATKTIDDHITARMPELEVAPDSSLLSAQMRAGLPDAAIRANIKLAISGGQNEPRDAIAGTIWALLSHPDQLAQVLAGEIPWIDAFNEYLRWVSPIGMSPRRVAKSHEFKGISLDPEARVFFMFGAANRDPAHYDAPERFDITRDASRHIAFGAGPHFCAGAAASKALIAEVALPMIFETLPGLRITMAPRIGGWAFRGLLELSVAWGP